MLRKSLHILLLMTFVAPALADEPPFEDALLDRLVGSWVLRGTIAGQEVTHDIEAAWVLGHQYLSFDEVSRERTPDGALAYEATVFIGWDKPSGRYVCLWLDSTGGGGLANDVYGYAEPASDVLAFRWVYDGGQWHTTFTYDREADAWDLRMDGISDDGETRPFARTRLTRP